MTTIGTSTAAPRPATAGRVQGNLAEGQQIKDEVHLEVTASELHTLTFQQKLADFSSRGIPVQVNLVQAGSAPAPAPVAAPVAAPAPATSAGRSMGPGAQMTGALTAIAAGGIAAVGAAVVGACLSTPANAVIQVLAEQGPVSLFANFLSLPAMVGVAVTGAAAALGGLKAGTKVGELMDKAAGPMGRIAYLATPWGMMDLISGNAPKIAPKPKPKPAQAPAQPLPKPGKKHRLEPLSRLVSHIVGGFSLMNGAVGGFTSGLLLTSGIQSLTGGVTAGAMGASLVMAGVVGAMSAWGGVRIGKGLIEGAD